MDQHRTKRPSIILAGSDMNCRMFGEEESWDSLQSTVLAGNLTFNNTTEVEMNKDLTPVDEESLSKDDLDDTKSVDILNVNMAAIGSDDEAFFDCPSYSPKYSPMKSKSSTLNPGFKSSKCSQMKSKSPTLSPGFKYFSQDSLSPMKSKPSTLSPGLKYSSKDSLSPMKSKSSTLSPDCKYSKYSPIKSKYGNVLTTSSASVINQTSTLDSGLHERTGSLLAQIVVDFNDIRSEAQSTPNLEKIVSGQFYVDESSSEQDHSSKSKSKKVSKSKNKKGTNSPAEWKPARRVATMKEFFESKSKFAEASCAKTSLIPKLSTSSSTTSKLQTFKTLLRSRSPTYKTMIVPRLVITPARRSIASPANKSGSRLLRPTSCSEYTSESLDIGHSQKSRSHSSSEVERNVSVGVNHSADLMNCSRLGSAIKSRKVSTKPYFITNRKSTVLRNSPTSQSAITKRRSIGIAAKLNKSPIKPVRELRKVFSPPRKPIDALRK